MEAEKCRTRIILSLLIVQLIFSVLDLLCALETVMLLLQQQLQRQSCRLSKLCIQQFKKVLDPF